jgi:hypothetical protein
MIIIFYKSIIFLTLCPCVLVAMNNIVKENIKTGDDQAYAINGFWICQDDGFKIKVMLQDFKGTGTNWQTDTDLLKRTRFRNIEYLGDNTWCCEQCFDLPLQLIPKDTSRLLWLEAFIELINEETFKVGDKVYIRN